MSNTAARSNGTGTPANTISRTLAVTAGQPIVVKVKGEGTPSGFTISIADGGVNTYTAIDSFIDGGNGDFWMQCFWAKAATTTTLTIVATLSASATRPFMEMDAAVADVTGGMQVTTPAASHPQANGTSAAPSAGSITRTVAGITFTMFGSYNTENWHATAGWTALLDGSSPSGSPILTFRSGGTTAVNGDATTDDIIVWIAQSVHFPETSAGGGGGSAFPTTTYARRRR